AANLKFQKVTPVNDWFEIFRINDTTFAILEPHHDEEVISYLLLGSEKAALIDTGMGIANIKVEVEEITDLPVIVLNTHTHFDHTGDNFQFNEIACFDHSFEIDNLNNGHGNQFCSNFMHPTSYKNLPSGFEPAEYQIKPSKITTKLNHLDEIDIGNRMLKIHHTPGHSPGSICIEDKNYKLLYTGDTYYRGTLVSHLPGSNYPDYLKSIDYLISIARDMKALCPGHNECYAPADDFDRLQDAVIEINTGQKKCETSADSRFYQFDHFNIRVPLDLNKQYF
ncbi:MAG: MBL fold metallo-hydrolase, partial [Proteobacteria bacterium]|nr:MBL fold metallo-hydrolase [Pseudomonadota bacterium]